MAIGLALSGGGLRATLFHLGVVRAMRDANVLRDVAHICSVSGGSILAAHLVLHWEDYLGDGFDKRAKEILDFCSFDVRNHILRRYPSLMSRWVASRLVPFHLVTAKGPTDLLQKYYGRLFGDATIENLRGAPGQVRPKLHILTTNLTTATLCSFGSDGYQSEAAPATGRRPRAKVHIQAATPSLCFAVAASSAFPGLFSPLRLTADTLGKFDAELEPAEQFVTDGGVYDNLGVRHFQSAPEELERLDRIFVSNAGAELKTGGGREHVGLLKTALRASDILAHRVHQLESATMDRPQGGALAKFVPINIRDVVPREEEAEALHENSQEWLRWMRTDLDRFTPFEMHCLIRHGWGLARRAIRAAGRDVPSGTAWQPVSSSEIPPNAVTQVKLLAKSVVRRARLFSVKDRISWIQAAGVLLLAALAFTGYRARENHLDHLKKRAADAETARQKEKDQADADRKRVEGEREAERAKLAAEAEAEAARVKKQSDQILEIQRDLGTVRALAAEGQHRLSVEISHRHNADGTGFRPKAEKETAPTSATDPPGPPQPISWVTLAILHSLLRDKEQLGGNLRSEQQNVLMHVFAADRTDHNRKASEYADLGDGTTDDSKARWKMFRERSWMWMYNVKQGYFQIDPSAWCISALCRLIEQTQMDDPARAMLIEYLEGAWIGLKSFKGDKDGVWVIVADQEGRNRTHPWAAGLALMAFTEYHRVASAKWKEELQTLMVQACRVLVEQWEKPGWKIRKSGGEEATSDALTMFTYAALLRVARIDRQIFDLPADMITDIKERVERMQSVNAPPPSFLEDGTVARKDGKGSAPVSMLHAWLPWAIDCTHEWFQYVLQNDRSNLDEMGRSIGVLVKLLKMGESLRDPDTEGLAEYHLPMTNILGVQY